MRYLIALFFCLLALPALALTVEERLQYLESFHPPQDTTAPVLSGLAATCTEGQACQGQAVANEAASFAWGTTAGFTGNADGTWDLVGASVSLVSVPVTATDTAGNATSATLDITVNASAPPPPPPSGAFADFLAAITAGFWAQWGAPWSDLETSGAIQAGRDNCNSPLSSITGAWNGVVWDGPNVWQFAAGGHGDGCFNGIVHYDLEAGAPVLDAPHVQLNMPLCYLYKNGTDCWNMPYASATPWAACAGQGDNCIGLSKEDRLANGPTVESALEFRIPAEAPGTEMYGAFLRPRSSHTHQNTVRIGDYIYFFTTHTYGSIKEGNQVWRFSVNDPANTIERMPDRVKNETSIIGGISLNFVQPAGTGKTFMISGSSVCDIDPAIGSYSCTSFPVNITVNGVAAWDESRSGVWIYDINRFDLHFVHYDGATWTLDTALSVDNDPLFTGTGAAGICIVPTANGTNPVIWGDGSRLIRWDGTTLSEITGQMNQPAGHGHMENKWTWDADHGVCLGTWDWNGGIWAWRPDFSNWQQAENPPPSGEWPVFAGQEVRPAPWTPAAWDQPIERQPEAPDYDALCPGPWATLEYRTEAELAGSAAQMRALQANGTPNARVYVYPREDAAEPYQSALVFDKMQCGEAIGVPVDGQRPVINENIGLAKIGAGFIVRGFDFEGGHNVKSGCNLALRTCPAFIVLHDNRMGGAGIMGVSDPTMPTTYLELRGNFFGPNLDWHGMYLERSIGKLVALSNVFHASGNSGHALKDLANYSRIEGNVLSNVGLDGQPFVVNGKEFIGLYALDYKGCTEGIIRNNTIVFRTSGNVATMLVLRTRNSWGGCDKGRRLADGSRELFPPESPEYLDEQRWDEINIAAQDFDAGYEAARANPELFTHLIEGNTFIAFEGKPGVLPVALTSLSLRPIADNPVEADLKAQMAALIELCADAPVFDDCWFANASEEVIYVHDHIQPSRRYVMRHGNSNGAVEVPNALPIRAPSNWTERAGVFWDQDQTYIQCNADGSICAERAPYSMNISPPDWDDVAVSSPPRVMLR